MPCFTEIAMKNLFARRQRLLVLSGACIFSMASLVACHKASETAGKNPSSAAAAAAAKEENKPLYWYDPMHPSVHFDAPGKSPFMDMQLVPRYAEAQGDSAVEVSPAVVQTLGIRTAQPTLEDVRAEVRVPARVVADARGQARLQARVSGFIERLHVRAAGQNVAAGEVIAEIYSEQLAQAQEELLLGADTATGATERLRRMGIADADIQAVQRSGQALRRLPLRAPVSGVITELGVRQGSSVTADSLIADIAPRGAVWVEAMLFPAQRLQLGKSLQATFTLPGQAQLQWTAGNGTVVPEADPVTQTLAVRFAVDNRQSDLPLGTQLDARILGATRSQVLLVPVWAVIRTASGAHVLVARANNKFAPTAVEIGERYDDRIEIRSGLNVKDRVVVSGQFLLDAEANLQAGFNRMDEPAAPGQADAGAHRHD